MTSAETARQWVFYAVELVTGAIVAELPLSAFSGERSLVGGTMSASLPIAHLPAGQARELLLLTSPGRYSIAAERDGVLVGEWIIWKRSRSNDNRPLSLAGAEVVSALDRRVMDAWTYGAMDQIAIAKELLSEGFGHDDLLGRIPVLIPAITPSGQIRDRAYVRLDGDIGQRLRELSEVENGFDYLVTSERDSIGRSAVTRTARFYYPRAGADLPYVFEASAPQSPPGNVLDVALAEDGMRLGSRAYAVGATTDQVPTIGIYDDRALVAAGYPFFEQTHSWSDVSVQATADSYARSLWQESQSADLPLTVTVLADRFPGFGDYQLGDRLSLSIEPSGNFPDGYQGRIRVIGWTHSPMSSAPETFELSVTREPA